MLSNPNPENTNPEDYFFEKLCSGYNITEISAVRQINSKASSRGKITELLIRNYKWYIFAHFPYLGPKNCLIL